MFFSDSIIFCDNFFHNDSNNNYNNTIYRVILDRVYIYNNYEDHLNKYNRLN